MTNLTSAWPRKSPHFSTDNVGNITNFAFFLLVVALMEYASESRRREIRSKEGNQRKEREKGSYFSSARSMQSRGGSASKKRGNERKRPETAGTQ